LATDPAALSLLPKRPQRGGIDKVFCWNGDSALFLAIIKYVEDSINIKPDTERGVVKAILVIEDSPVHYSNFLPIIYTQIMRQTQALIAEGLNEYEKWFRKKARPKILLAETFEEGMEIYTIYREHLLGIITDVAYPRGECVQDDAGFQFIQEVVDEDIPVLIQSSHLDHKTRAELLQIPFLHKQSETLTQELGDFLKGRLGFGDFVFLMPDGKQVARASDIKEFVEIVQRVPLESIRYHGARNDFSRYPKNPCG